MKIRSLGYLICEGAKNVRANFQISIASIGVLIACMLLMGISVLFSMNINSLMKLVEDSNEAVVFIEEGATDETITKLGELLDSHSNIDEYEFVSKEEALEQQKEFMAEAAGLLEGLEGDENPLPASYTIKIDDIALMQNTIDWVDAQDGVDYTSAPLEVAQILTDISGIVFMSSVFLVGILATVSVIIISNTVKVAVFNRRKEISIMKYVGATDAFIRFPFLIEGAIIGMFSAVFSFCFLWLGYWYLMDTLSQSNVGWVLLIYTYMIDFGTIATRMFLGFFSTGAIFGFLGSTFFVNKYLKV